MSGQAELFPQKVGVHAAMVACAGGAAAYPADSPDAARALLARLVEGGKRGLGVAWFSDPDYPLLAEYLERAAAQNAGEVTP